MRILGKSALTTGNIRNLLEPLKTDSKEAMMDNSILASIRLTFIIKTLMVQYNSFPTQIPYLSLDN